MKQKILCRWPLMLAVAFGIGIEFQIKGQETNEALNGNVLTLDSAVSAALAHNPEIQALEATVAEARGETITARTWDNPEFSISPGAYRESDVTWGHVGFELSQTILFPGKRALLRAVAEKNVQSRQLALSGFRTQLAIQVRRSFYELLAARQVIGLKEQQRALAKSFVDAARKKVEGGFAPEFEQTKAEVEMVAAQKALGDAQAQEAIARTTLNSWIGQAPNAPITLSGSLSEAVSVPAETVLLAQALERNPTLKVQTAEVERTGLNLDLTRKSRLPDFTVGPAIEYQKPEQVYAFAISLPLPFWDQKKGAIATATAGQQRALAELDGLRRDILRNVSVSSRLLAAARESLAIYTPEFRAKLKSALDTAAQSYSEGRTPLLLFLEAQRTYYDTEGDYFETLKKLYDARATLEAALGISLDELQSQ